MSDTNAFEKWVNDELVDTRKELQKSTEELQKLKDLADEEISSLTAERDDSIEQKQRKPNRTTEAQPEWTYCHDLPRPLKKNLEKSLQITV